MTNAATLGYLAFEPLHPLAFESEETSHAITFTYTGSRITASATCALPAKHVKIHFTARKYRWMTQAHKTSLNKVMGHQLLEQHPIPQKLSVESKRCTLPFLKVYSGVNLIHGLTHHDIEKNPLIERSSFPCFSNLRKDRTITIHCSQCLQPRNCHQIATHSHK